MIRGTRWYHLYRLGHSIRVNRGISIPAFVRDIGAKGWLYTCECGETWAK